MAFITLAELAGQLGSTDLGYTFAMSQNVVNFGFTLPDGTVVNRPLRFQLCSNARATYKRFDVLPLSNFRALGSEPSASNAQPRTIEIDAKYLTYEFDIDNKAVQKSSLGEAGEIAAQRMIAAHSLSGTFNKYFYQGNAETSSLQFNGLAAIAEAEGATVSMATDGAVITLAKLDELVEMGRECFGANAANAFLLMNSTNAVKVKNLLLAAGNNLQIPWLAAGIPLRYYADLPVYVIGNDIAGSALLPFTETQGNQSASASVYLITLSPSEGVPGLFGITDAAGVSEDIIPGKIGPKHIATMTAALGVSHKYAVCRLKGTKAS